ncbi:diaminopropionate ammonia-lyase [Vibrio sp. SCSIO 43137]|uniref:diaminopropionate ammonia-lyase n=1 Tax=Vibrio sp. SCSIO 43137 TaxID=3021011 RepID=UPI0023075A37|nr:diaminopropionate ammonia-lyase [Vibrio sp. SCSIO 43137]WCE32191.1 diaminopropionate ammonia-lyase [Vibrio sp. SCSIO 43137]
MSLPEKIIPNVLKSIENKSYAPSLSKGFEAEDLLNVRNFHSQLPGYCKTPLHSLDALAEKLGVRKVLLKDEDYRFDLNAFKVLGGSYAIARLLGNKYGLSASELSLENLKAQITEPMTFTSATDGNHGRGIAWSAEKLGQNAVIYMPVGTAEERVRNIQKLGAEVIVTDCNYDDTVRIAYETSQKNGWEFVQDTAWEGYTDIPLWIMQGYATIVSESIEQMEEMGEVPTHIILQAGVGSMAGAILGSFVNHYGIERLVSLIVEPEKADCIYRSGLTGDIVFVNDDLDTIMAGLACGEPCTIGWDILKDNASGFLSCNDSLAATGMRILANPLAHDPKVVSGESGAIGVGALHALATNSDAKALMNQFAFDENSVVYILSTEGNTDPVNYQKVIWEGAYPS